MSTPLGLTRIDDDLRRGNTEVDELLLHHVRDHRDHVGLGKLHFFRPAEKGLQIDLAPVLLDPDLGPVALQHERDAELALQDRRGVVELAVAVVDEVGALGLHDRTRDAFERQVVCQRQDLGEIAVER
ncbi:MAG: hypothetical protein MUE68_13005 [Bacteroidetes bacterium]|nr:hypothetical protein [Bacteroidota bacterium]